jgi:hypothetical protein
MKQRSTFVRSLRNDGVRTLIRSCSAFDAPKKPQINETNGRSSLRENPSNSIAPAFVLIAVRHMNSQRNGRFVRSVTRFFHL